MSKKYKHKVETEFHIEPFADGTLARCIISVSVDGSDCGSLTVLSGPINDVKDFHNGKMTMDEVAMKWAHDK